MDNVSKTATVPEQDQLVEVRQRRYRVGPHHWAELAEPEYQQLELFAAPSGNSTTAMSPLYAIAWSKSRQRSSKKRPWFGPVLPTRKLGCFRSPLRF